MLWGHTSACNCSLCLVFPRIFHLISFHSQYPGFVQRASERVRLVESEIRDIAGQVVIEHSQRVPGPAPLQPPPPPKDGSLGGKGSGAGRLERREPSAPKAPCGPPAPGITPKAASGVVFGAAEAKSIEVKVEDQSEGAGPLQEVRGVSEETKKREKSRKSKRKSRSPKQRSRSRKHRPRRREKSEKRQEERERDIEARGEGTSPKSHRGRENSRSERSPRRKERTEESTEEKRPLTPENPPLGREASSTTGSRKGSGWRGPVPYSDHPRWKDSKNKGITKRAKQEVFNRKKWRHGT